MNFWDRFWIMVGIIGFVVGLCLSMTSAAKPSQPACTTGVVRI